MLNNKNAQIAIIHEWFTTFAGSERVTSAILNLYENSKVYCIVDFLDDNLRECILKGKKTNKSLIQRLPFSKQHFRVYLALFPFAIRRFNLKKYRLIISSSHAFAHGIKTNKDQLHISYCHTPMRYIWDLQDLYLKANKMHKGIISVGSKLLAKKLRKWDYKVAQKVDYYISNSHYTANRIQRCYNREAKVIYPPVETNQFEFKAEKKDFYITASRIVSYKRVDLIVKAFSQLPDKKLIVVGDGKFAANIKQIATPNIIFHPHLPFEKFHELMRDAKAFVFAGEEDFGITMVEAQACGTPVIAFKRGGAAEIVKHNETGVLFEEQTESSLINAITVFEKISQTLNPNLIRKNSERFDRSIFEKKFTLFVEQCIEKKFDERK